ncbi:MAG: bifunctional methylenetetrahydrofolate dehydrogenase/methenyltetrahydrofolate cyclohydrolase, partial [Lachnospiraceae bacterium]|nr:bifunctional methylenetetrahydrofolate dehydrogenase/methenyltetrahydrofolate cyclohydrolase [Lachnospiraceae bacterium]
MAAKIIDGKAVAAKVKEEVKAACAKLKEERGLIPKLVVIQVGDMGPSTIYVRNKKKACEQVGIESEIWHLPDTITQDELLDKIEKCNQDDSIHGVLVQLPLPAHLD